MSVFDRLSRQGTISSLQKQRHRNPAHPQPPATRTPQQQPSRRGKDIRPQQQRTGADVGGDGSNKMDHKCNMQQRKSLPARTRPQKTDQSYPIVGSASMTIQCRTKVEKKEEKPYSTLPLGALPEIRKAMHDFESGASITERQLAYEIISQLFYRDFMPGRHWDVDPATVTEMSGATKDLDGDDNSLKTEDIVWFAAEKEATWDHKDIYSVASAKAVIKISRQLHLVVVDEYSYYVAG